MEEYGIFQILEKLDERDKYHHQLCRIRCKYCGREFIRAYSQVKAPSSYTTVCNHKRKNGEDIQYGIHWKNSRIRSIYAGIISRCFNEEDRDYRFYGAKGVSICKDWQENPLHFEDWALANGYEDNLTIDRKDETKDYSPDNCRWITGEENARWKSTTNRIDVDGEIKTGQQWAKYLGFGPNLINSYIRKYGWDNTVEFIRRYKAHPYQGLLPHKTSYYSIYMSDNYKKENNNE